MKLRWGILGLGNIAHEFTKDLQLVKEAEIWAVASRSKEKAIAFGQQYGIQNCYGSYDQLFDDPDVDIVYIATPHNTHMDLSIAAMNKGKHVLCEKPLAVNVSEIEKMVAVAASKKVFLMDAFWSRFNPSIQACLKYVEANTIGTVNYINADFTFFRDDPEDSRMLNMDLAGGSLLDMGVYPVFLTYLLLGKPEVIKAIGCLHQTGADLQTVAVFKYPNAVASIMSGFRSQSDMVAKIYGTKGRIYISPYWHETQGITLIKGNGQDTETEFISLPTQGKGFTYEIEECHNCIANNQLQSKLWSWQNSIDLIAITDEIRKQIGLIYPFE